MQLISDEEILDETLHQSQMKNQTRSKSRKVVVPEPLLPSDSEDEDPRQQPSKRNRASPAADSSSAKSRWAHQIFQTQLESILKCRQQEA